MTPETEPCILSLEETSSTNTYVREHFDTLPDGSLVTARFQTAGRGRLGRKWVAPPGVNFCGTFCFKNISNGFHAGMIAGVSLLKTVEHLIPDGSFYLKWPNDLYYGKAKLAGLLGEGVVRNGKIAGVAMGIGLNVNMSDDDLSTVGQKAVSLKSIAKQEFNPDFIAKLLAKYVNACYIIYSNSVDEIFAEWRSGNKLIGRELAVTDANGKRFEGLFKDVTSEGEMVLEYTDPSGGVTEKIFNCGDVSVDKSSI